MRKISPIRRNPANPVAKQARFCGQNGSFDVTIPLATGSIGTQRQVAPRKEGETTTILGVGTAPAMAVT